MITDPKDNVFQKMGEGAVVKGGSFGLSFSGINLDSAWTHKIERPSVAGIRIIMNVIDMKKLMEMNK